MCVILFCFLFGFSWPCSCSFNNCLCWTWPQSSQNKPTVCWPSCYEHGTWNPTAGWSSSGSSRYYRWVHSLITANAVHGWFIEGLWPLWNSQKIVNFSIYMSVAEIIVRVDCSERLPSCIFRNHENLYLFLQLLRLNINFLCYCNILWFTTILNAAVKVWKYRGRSQELAFPVSLRALPQP